MDKALRKKKEQKATANIDLSIFLQKENEQEQELYLFETDKILAQEALQQNKKIRGSLRKRINTMKLLKKCIQSCS